MTSGPSAALANLTEVLTSGRQQGTVDRRADHHRASLRYVGPVLEQPAWAGLWTPPWPPDDQRPLVVVSTGTTFMRQERARRRCVDATMPLRALVTVGPALQRVLRGLSFREAAGRLRRAIQADVAADRAVAELEALADAIPPLERAQEQLPAE